MKYYSFINVELIAVGLNPLIISHIARTISLNMIGRYKNIDGVIKFVTSNMFTTINNIDAMKPQIDSQMGTSFDLYNR